MGWAEKANSYQSSSNPLFVNVVFSGNVGFFFGGGIANVLSSVPTLVNTTFSDNSSTGGGGAIHGIMTNAILKNSILWGNTTGAGIPSQVGGSPLDPASSNNLVEGEPGAGDPLFADADGPDDTSGTLDDDLVLLAGSPAIDAGDNSFLPADTVDLDKDGDFAEAVPLDFGETPRRQFGGTGVAPLPAVDLGAHEFGAVPGGLDSDGDGLPGDFEFFHTGSFTALAPLTDDDQDTIPALAEFYFNLDPGFPDLQLLHDHGTVIIGPHRYLTLTYRRNRFAAAFATCTVQRALALGSWFAGETAEVSVTTIDADTELVTVRSLFPMGATTTEFLRTAISP